MIFLLSACLQSFRGNSNQRRICPSTIVVISKDFLAGGVLDEGMDFEDSFVLVATTGAGQSKKPLIIVPMKIQCRRWQTRSTVAWVVLLSFTLVVMSSPLLGVDLYHSLSRFEMVGGKGKDGSPNESIVAFLVAALVATRLSIHANRQQPSPTIDTS
jgi:hypothetical protein